MTAATKSRFPLSVKSGAITMQPKKKAGRPRLYTPKQNAQRKAIAQSKYRAKLRNLAKMLKEAGIPLDAVRADAVAALKRIIAAP